MATNAYFLNQFISTTLSSVGGIDDTQTTGIILASSVNLDTGNPGIACLTYTDPLDITRAEWITYTSIDAGTNELQGVTRGQEGYSAKSHNNGTTIVFPLSESHINNLNTALMIDNVATNLTEGVLSENDMVSNSATKLATQRSIKTYIDARDDGWVSANETWTYASATTITVPSRATNKYQKGDKIKLTQGSVKYFYIVGVTSTVLTIIGGNDYTLTNSAISNNYYSKVGNPQGFPSAFAFTPTISFSGGSGNIAPTFSQEKASFKIDGRTVNISIRLTNSSGGTAGAGTGIIVLDYPGGNLLSNQFNTGGIHGTSYYLNGATTWAGFCQCAVSGIIIMSPELSNVLGNNLNDINIRRLWIFTTHSI